MTTRTRGLSAWRYSIFAALALGAAVAQTPSVTIPSDASPTERRILTAVEQARTRPTDARRVLDEIVDGAELDRARPGYRQTALEWAAALALNAREFPRARALLLRATATETATAWSWQMLAVASVNTGDLDAIRALTVLAERWPQQLAATDPRLVRAVASEAMRGEDDGIRLLTALFKAHWTIPNVGEPSVLWSEFALLLLEGGDAKFAKEVALRVTDAQSLVVMRADARFDGLIGADRGRFDPATAATAEIARAQEQLRSSRDRIAPILTLSRAFAANNRCAEALEIADAAIARASGPTAEEKPFLDVGEQLVWLLDERSRYLACLGRWEESVRQRSRASILTERGGPNTSQMINFAHLLVTVGRSADALRALEDVGPMSEYGRMEETWARLRAHAQLGNAEGVRTALAYLEEHRDVSLDVYLDALVDGGEIEKTAQLLIELLADRRARTGILVRLQRYAESPLTPVGIERKERWDSVVARPDVRAAVARVGRLETYPSLRRLQSVE